MRGMHIPKPNKKDGRLIYHAPRLPLRERRIADYGHARCGVIANVTDIPDKVTCRNCIKKTEKWQGVRP